MKNPILDRIKKDIIATFNSEYGYCGCAEGDVFVILNSGGDGENFVITIKDQNGLDQIGKDVLNDFAKYDVIELETV